METHPSYKDVQSICQKYPKAAGSFFQVYNDILLSQQWKDVKVIDIEPAGRAVISGKKRANEPARIVVPCALRESISIEWFNAIFANLTPEPSEIYVAITSDDSSTVYYKISKGIVKPPI